MARRSDHTRDELKTLILEAAWSIIGTANAEGLTARRVASEIGYAPGTVYNLFESMDDLILHVNMRTLGMLRETLSSPACNDPALSPVQNALKMSALYRDFARQNRPYWLLLYTHTLPAERFRDQSYQETIDGLFSPLERILAPIYPANAGQEIKVAARALWAAVHGITFLQESGKLLLLEGQTTPQETADYLIETFFAGLEV
jgi:AcrR family transcriptional regulator